MSRIRRHGLSIVAPVALAATLLLVSCLDDPSGPGVQPGFLALAPSFQSSAAGIVDVDSIHVTLVRNSDQTVALDTVVAVDTDSDTVDLSFSVLVSSSSETFTLTLDCLSPTGEVVFSAGPIEVTATTSGADDVVAEEVPIEYVGVGSNAADIDVPGDDVFYIHMDDTLTLEAQALDSSGVSIAGTPIKWSSEDTTRLTFPDPAVGRMQAGQIRGRVLVTAELLTGPSDIVEVFIEPVPSTVAIVSGDGQTGPVLEQLSTPLVVEVTAADGLGVEDVTVGFATSDGGSVGQASVITGADGRAATTWTLGSSQGTQTATATVSGLAPVNFSATATAEVLFRDDFEDGDLVGWNCFDGDTRYDDGAFSVQNGELIISGQTGSGYKLCLAGDPAWTNYAVEATVTNLGGFNANIAAMMFRADPVGEAGYDLRLNGISQKLSVVTQSFGDHVPSRWVSDKSYTVTFGQPYRLRVEVYGNTITGYVDGAPEFQFVDSEFATGQIALSVVESQARFDDVLVTTVNPPPNLTIPELRFTVEPSTTAPAGTIAPAVVVTAYDETGAVDASFTGSVEIDFDNNPTGGTLSGTLIVAAVGGVATFSDLSIDLAGSGYTLYAVAPNLLSASSAPFDIVAAGPQQVSWINPAGGNWSNGANWDTGMSPDLLDDVIIDLDGTYIVTLDADASAASLSLGGATESQTLAFSGFTLTTNGTALVGTNGILDVGTGMLSGFGHLYNDGTVDLAGGSIDMPMDNTGDLIATGGTSSLNGLLTTDGNSLIQVSGEANANASLTVSVGFSNAGLIDISQGTNYSNYTNTLSVTLGTLTNTGTIQSTVGARAGTRVLDANVDNQGSIELVSHDLVFTGTHTLTTDAGTVTIPDGRTLTLNNGTTAILGTGTSLTPTATGRIIVNGDISLASDFTLAGGAPAIDLDNNSTNASTITGTGTFTNADTVFMREDSFDVPFVNQGEVRAYERGSGGFFNGAFSNTASGVLRILVENSSGVTVANGFTNAGLIDISQGTDFTNYTSTFTVTTGTLTNTGTIQSSVGLRTGTRVLNADVGNQGTIALVNHNLVFSGAHTLTTDAGTVTISEGETLTLNNGTTTILGSGTTLTPTTTGQIAVNGDITLASDFTLASGAPTFNLDNNSTSVSTIAGPFTFTNADTVMLRDDVIDVDVTFINQGELLVYDWTTGSELNGTFSNDATGVFRLLVLNSLPVTVATGFTNAGLIDISQGRDYNNFTSTLVVTTGTLNNTGTIQSSVGARAGDRVLISDVNNAGTIDVQASPFDFVLSGSFAHTDGAVLQGSGTLDLSGATVTALEGDVNPGTSPGVLTITGEYDFDALSEFNVELDGTIVGTEYDQFDVSGDVTLSGALNVTAGVPLAEGNSFTVLNAASITGDFTTITGLDLGGGLILDPIRDGTSLGFVVVSTPLNTDAVWEGTTSTNWAVGSNWSTGTVPTDVENVWIRQAPANQPIVGSNQNVGTVVVQAGATITVSTGFVLSVNGNLDAGTSIVGGGGVTMMGSGTTLTGTVNNIVIQNDVTLSGPVIANGVASVESGQLTLGGNTMTAAGGFATGASGVLVMNNAADVLNATNLLFEGGSTDGSLTAGTINVTGAFTQSSVSSTTSFAASGIHRTVFNGTGPQDVTFEDHGAALSRFQEMEAEGSASVVLPYVSGNGAYVTGDLNIRGTADVSPGCWQIDVAGHLTTSESGTITMTCGDYARMVVEGDANFDGGSTDGRLTDGELVVRGNFSQSGAVTSFAASGNHIVRLDGLAVQQVQFANSSTTESHFNSFNVAQTGTRPGVTLASDVVALDFLSTTGDSIAMQTIAGAGQSLTVGGLNVDGLELDEALLVWADSGAFTGNFLRFAVLRFMNHTATSTRMDVIHTGRATTYPFDDIFYGTESIDGYYLRAEDIDGTLINTLLVNLDFRIGSATCWDPGNFMSEPADYLEVNGADISDVDFFCRFS